MSYKVVRGTIEYDNEEAFPDVDITECIYNPNNALNEEGFESLEEAREEYEKIGCGYIRNKSMYYGYNYLIDYVLLLGEGGECYDYKVAYNPEPYMECRKAIVYRIEEVLLDEYEGVWLDINIGLSTIRLTIKLSNGEVYDRFMRLSGSDTYEEIINRLDSEISCEQIGEEVNNILTDIRETLQNDYEIEVLHSKLKEIITDEAFEAE